MTPTRRDLLRLSLGTSTLLACGGVPAFLARSAAALARGTADTKGRVLVVLQLDGGNDGLNTIVPYRDDDYKKHRPKLQLTGERLHRIDDHISLHPALGGFAKLLEARQLAVVQSVGYPNPSRSHFDSMAIWHAARLKPRGDVGRGHIDEPGWLARALDAMPSDPGGDAPALHVNDTLLPDALASGQSQRHMPSFHSLEQFRRRLGIPAQAGAAEHRSALDRIVAEKRGEPGSLLDFIRSNTVITYASSALLESVLKGRAAPTGYPDFALAQRLKLIGQLIKAGLTTALYYTQLDGFDTHINQLGRHDNLLREIGESLRVFLEDLYRSGESERVLVLVFSEFGRRLAENASLGTDHGTAAPVFLLGAPVKAGPHGPYPNLRDLDDGGDPKHAIDFRQVYATVLDQWLGYPSDKVLGAKFAHLPVLRKV